MVDSAPPAGSSTSWAKGWGLTEGEMTEGARCFETSSRRPLKRLLQVLSRRNADNDQMGVETLRRAQIMLMLSGGRLGSR